MSGKVKKVSELKEKNNSIKDSIKNTLGFKVDIPPEITYRTETTTKVVTDDLYYGGTKLVTETKYYYSYNGEECGEGSIGKFLAKSKRQAEASNRHWRVVQVLFKIEEINTNISELRNDYTTTMDALKNDIDRLESFMSFEWVFDVEGARGYFEEGCDKIYLTCGKNPEASQYRARGALINLTARCKDSDTGSKLNDSLNSLIEDATKLKEDIFNYKNDSRLLSKKCELEGIKEELEAICDS